MNYSKGILVCATILLASAAVGSVAVPAQAKGPVVVTGPSSDTITRRVSYSDLNLASLAGEKTLKRRVGATVNDVCGELSPSVSVDNRLCESLAWRGARPQIAQAVLRAKQMASTGQSLIAVSAITLTFGQ